jgi:hypothetical protein
VEVETAAWRHGVRGRAKVAGGGRGAHLGRRRVRSSPLGRRPPVRQIPGGTGGVVAGRAKSQRAATWWCPAANAGGERPPAGSAGGGRRSWRRWGENERRGRWDAVATTRLDGSCGLWDGRRRGEVDAADTGDVGRQTRGGGSESRISFLSSSF